MEENKERDPVPYFVHEEILARQERNTKRLFILCIIIFVALIGTNAGWILYESQFEDVAVTQEISQDSGEGGTNTYTGKIVGGDDYGETDDQNNSENETQEDGVGN